MSPEAVIVSLADLQSIFLRLQSKWLTVASAAKYSDLSEESIRRLIAAGKLTPHRPVKGRVLIDRDELDSVIRSSTQSLRKGRGIR